jgi:hypothetical protein
MAPAAPALAKKHIHSVWCPNETGTLIGGTGRWIDVDDNGNIVSNTGVKSTTGFSRVERVSLQWEAAPRYNGSTGRNTTSPSGRNSPIESTGYSIYFPVGAGAGATTSLCCALQAPSSKAVTRAATIMIIFRNFNLSRLLSSQIAPFRLGGEPRRSNAFLHFFEPSQIGRPGLFRVAGSACACVHYFLLLLRTSSQSQGS